MDTAPPPALSVHRVAEHHWRAIEDDLTIGRAEAFRRPDGRLFVSIEAWHSDVFGRLAEALRTDLPRPLHTIVDEADTALLAQWRWAGFSILRREWEYVVPTETPCGQSSLTILPPGTAQEDLLQNLDRLLRNRLDWSQLPPEILPGGTALADPSRYAVAVRSGEYVGLARVVPIRRQPRVGLIAVRPDLLRHGIARALLSGVLDWARSHGAETVAADIKESNTAAIALFESFDARRGASSLELILA